MNCREYRKHINSMLDARDYRSEDIAGHEHIRDCASCANYAEFMIIMNEELKSLRNNPLPRELHDRLLRVNPAKSLRSIMSGWKPEIKKALPLLLIPAVGMTAGMFVSEHVKIIIDFIIVTAGLTFAMVSFLKIRILGA